MALDRGEERPIAAAFFCPQSKAPDEEYLAGLQSFLSGNQVGKELLEEISDLRTAWEIFAHARSDIQELSEGRRYMNLLRDWAQHGVSGPVTEVRSGIIALPVLVILQVAQYLRYLEVHKLTHNDFLVSVQHAGGLQGYCGGLPSAIAIACASNEVDIVRKTATVLRIVLGIGAYATIAENGTNEMGSTTLALRLKYEGQGDDLTRLFSGTHVSAITDPRSISIVGSASKLDALCEYAQGQGLQVQKMDIRGKVHNPENEDLAVELSNLCDQFSCLRLPDATALRVAVRSNKTAKRLVSGSLTEEIISTVLASKCNWYNLLNQVAEDFEATGRVAHICIVFGMNDCVPMSPFYRKRMQIVKTEAHSFIHRRSEWKADDSLSMDASNFPNGTVAVIGASCRLPGASNLEELWHLISNGTDCHQEPPIDRFNLYGSFRASQSGSLMNRRNFYGNFLDDIGRFDNRFFGVNAREATNMDPQQRILLELSYEALESCGYHAKHHGTSEDNVGCFIGASLVEYLDNTNAHGPTAYTSAGTIRAFLCGRLSHYYKWSGPSEVIDTACSSSLVAINRACKALQTGECTMAVAGGINAITGINNFLDLSKAGFLSPTGQCKPFDSSADGYCRSDGGGLVVLKEMKQAIRNGDLILGVIPSVATNQGGLSASITVPHSATQQTLYRTVLDRAGLQAEQVTYVEAHGTGTQAGDPIEMHSIRSVFGSSSRSNILYVGSVKGNIGHCETAAGVASLLKILAMLRHREIPPQANHKQLNPKIQSLTPDCLDIARSLRAWDVPLRAALINSYGAAGSNCALLCCEMPNKTSHTTQERTSQHIGVALPIILSAASETSLLRYTRVLSLHLRKIDFKLDMKDISFTLNEARRRHRYCLATTATSPENLSRRLNSSERSMFEFPQTSKPVVLAFSGQNDSKVALDKSFYDSYPSFRAHIDACDAEVKSLGYKTLIPSIFQKESITDVVALQCCIFAIQYASARCWLDAGLSVSTIIGHSLGELTALAISKSLSLPDCIKLVARRAHLIKTKWGTENGAMLAIHGSVEDFVTISSYLQGRTNYEKLEIACYNAESALVLAGACTAIDTAIAILSTEKTLQKIRFRRLDSSHGFHSILTEPILTDLNEIAACLQWNEPEIPLEICAPESLQSIKEYSVVKHARDPVFFATAVRRIEEHFGPCLWLEAGMNTPILRMTRKATQYPDAHTFQAVETQNLERSIDVISEIVCQTWRNGISLTHWSLLPALIGKCKQVWLPPYQFETTSHWLANIDRSMGICQSQFDGTSRLLASSNLSPSAQLVTRKGLTNEFMINTQSQRFQKIVRGHAVLQKPLCPASMYMECVIMAVQNLLEEPINASITFEELNFHAALGVNTDTDVALRVEEIASKMSWRFIVRSLTKTQLKPTSHASGTISLVLNPMLDSFQRLLGESIRQLERKQDTEKLTSKRAYKLFASVVHYEKFLQGIHAVTLDDWDALATIVIPEQQPNREESTIWQLCDTVVIDIFIQVLGLLINSSEHVKRGEIVVAGGINRVVVSSACKMSKQRSWKVYTKFCFSEDGHPIGDIFVYSIDGDLVVSLSGCRFVKLPISRLEKILDPANSTEEIMQPMSTPKYSALSSINAEETSTPATDAKIPALKNLIAEYTGLSKSDIPGSTRLADLGLDSLASVELVEELLSRFGLSITSDELVIATLGDLTQRLGSFNSGFIDPEVLQPTRANSPDDSYNQKSLISSSDQIVEKRKRIIQLLAEVSGVRPDDIREQQTLVDLGIDSLSYVDLKQEVEDRFSTLLDSSQLTTDCVVKDLFKVLGVAELHPSIAPRREKASSGTGVKMSHSAKEGRVVLPNPFGALKESEGNFTNAARRRGFLNYWSDTAPVQEKLLLAYISEAFRALGVDLVHIPCGSNVPQVSHLQKYDRLMQRLWDILEDHDVVNRKEGKVVRGSGRIGATDSSQLYKTFEADHRSYEDEVKLMRLTGPKLAACLSGKADPVSIMFGSTTSLKIIENFYSNSPMMSTLTEQLVSFLVTLLRNINTNTQAPVQILEVGAGTGGTTKKLVEALEAGRITSRYTFTDISPSLVSKARNKLRQYPWIEYATFNLEKEIPENFRNKYDIVISANCVHATTSRVASCRRLLETLTPGGFVVLSEVTRIMNWYDICFGLLDGWWLAEGSTAYPLQPAKAWMSTFSAAGFTSAGYSKGSTAEANTQQLLVGCNKRWDTALTTTIDHSPVFEGAYRLETMAYKEVSGIQVEADVFVPVKAPKLPMPIALMIHGGGHIMLSRKAIRPVQAQHLLRNGLLPISLDYRLCPEVDLINGPMTDAYDAYLWARTTVSHIALQRGFRVNPNKVVVIGWSTGGHLAMSIGWNAEKANVPPPAAVLSFYAPVDFESQELDAKRLPAQPDRTMSLEDIVGAISTSPVPNYDTVGGDRTRLGWIRPGDPRSELVLALFKEGIGLPLLLNGLPDSPKTTLSEWLAPPSPTDVAAISPLSQLRRGAYNTPTFVIHGTDDEVAPFAAAERFVTALKERQIRHGFLPIQGARHIHDLTAKPGTREWEEQVAPGYQFLFDVIGEV